MDPDARHSTPWTSRLFVRVIDHPWLAIAVFVLVSVGAALGYLDPELPARWQRQLFGQPESVRSDASNPAADPLRPRRLGSAANRRNALGRADTLLTVECRQMFTYEAAEALRDIVAELESLPTVASVTWMDNAPPLNIFGLPEPIVPRGHASPQRFELAQQKAVAHPLIVGQLLSQDAQTTVMLIGFDWAFVTEDADCTTRLVEAAERALQRHAGVEMQFSVTGPVPIRLMLIADRAANEVKYQVIGYGIIVVMAILLFRGFTVVLVVTLAPVTGLLWTLGYLRYFDLQDNPFSDVIVPVLICLVGFTDAVHMMVFLRTQLSEGQTPRVAGRNMLSAVGLACFLTSLTTAIGMGSLILAQNEVVQEFGWACVIGVTLVWISVMLVIPLACWTPWATRLVKGAQEGHVERSLDWVGAGVKWVLDHAKLVSYFSFALLAGLVAVACQLRPDDRTSNLMPHGSPAQVALAKLDQALGGMATCQVLLDWQDAPQAPAPAEVARWISQVDEILGREPLISYPLSLSRLLQAMPGDAPPEEKMSLTELLPPPLKLSLYNPAERQAKVTFRVQDLGTATYKPVFERIEAQLSALSRQHPGVQIELADIPGSPIWKWKNLYQIVVDLITSLATASVVIFCVLGIAFRSVRIGLISVVPNLVPLGASAATLVLVGKPLEMVSVCALTICLGIAVDDTIHFITRYQEEQRRPGSSRERLQRAFQGVGTGMIMTSVVLMAGFASVLTSRVPEHRTFALMGVVTLISALLSDLFLLPALLFHYDAPAGAAEEQRGGERGSTGR